MRQKYACSNSLNFKISKNKIILAMSLVWAVFGSVLITFLGEAATPKKGTLPVPPSPLDIAVTVVSEVVDLFYDESSKQRNSGHTNRVDQSEEVKNKCFQMFTATTLAIVSPDAPDPLFVCQYVTKTISSVQKIHEDLGTYASKAELKYYTNALIIDGWSKQQVRDDIRRNSAYCLDVHAPDVQTNGGKVQVWGCNNRANQQWRFDRGRLVNGEGKCLDVHAPDIHTNGGKVQVWDCNNRANQQWRFDRGRLIVGN